jgi:hypothetical protein
VSADDLFLHLETDDSGAIRRGDPARLEVRRGPEPDSEFVWGLSVPPGNPDHVKN